MKKNGLKTGAVFLFILQMALSLMSFIIIRRLFEKQVNQNIPSNDQLFLYIAIIINLFVSVVLLVFIYRLVGLVRQEQAYVEKETVELSVKEKIRADKKQQQVVKEEQQKRKLLLERLSSGIENINDVELFTEKVLINISKEFDIMQGIFFVKDLKDQVFRKQGAYAYYSEDELREFTEEVGLSGQVAVNKKLLNISNIPDKYITVLSGLGKSSPANLVIFPVLFKNESIGVIELASFAKFDSYTEELFMDFSVQIGEQLAKFIAVDEPSS